MMPGARRGRCLRRDFLTRRRPGKAEKREMQKKNKKIVDRINLSSAAAQFLVLALPACAAEALIIWLAI